MPKPDRNLDHLYPEFRAKVKAIVKDGNAWCKKHRPGHSILMTEGFRTKERQQELYAQGRTAPGQKVTQKNGTTNPSKHQSALAADFVLVSPTMSIWGDEEFWAYLGHLARKYGLTWGGDWRTFNDKPHVEWPASDKTTYAAAKAWKKTAGLS